MAVSSSIWRRKSRSWLVACLTVEGEPPTLLATERALLVCRAETAKRQRSWTMPRPVQTHLAPAGMKSLHPPMVLLLRSRNRFLGDQLWAKPTGP